MQTKEIDILFSFLCFSFQNHTQIVCESRGRMNDTFQFSLAISHYYSERCTTTIIFSFHRCSFVPFRLRRTSPELLAIPTTKRVPVYRLNVRACVRCVCVCTIVLSFHIGFRFGCGCATWARARNVSMSGKWTTIIHLRPQIHWVDCLCDAAVEAHTVYAKNQLRDQH